MTQFIRVKPTRNCEDSINEYTEDGRPIRAFVIRGGQVLPPSLMYGTPSDAMQSIYSERLE